MAPHEYRKQNILTTLDAAILSLAARACCNACARASTAFASSCCMFATTAVMTMTQDVTAANWSAALGPSSTACNHMFLSPRYPDASIFEPHNILLS